MKFDFFKLRRVSRMKKLRIFLLLAVLIFSSTVVGQGAKRAAAASATQAQQAEQAPPTIASVMDREISSVEKAVLEAAEAMPEEKFNFSPESLHIPGSEYKGVRSFAVQVKHV